MRILSFLALGLVVAAVACSDDDTEQLGPSTSSTSDAGSTDAATPPSDVGNSFMDDAGIDAGSTDAASTFTLQLPWADGAAIPPAYTCSGADGSPAVSWSGAPAGTQSFAIVMRDTSLAPPNNYHWVLYGIPSDATSLPASLPRTTTLATPVGARQTDWSFSATPGYGGPCPPAGALHDYELTLHALNAPLATSSTDPVEVAALVESGSIGHVRIVGTFVR